MAEMSKTALAAKKAVEAADARAKGTVIRSTGDIIKGIRDNRAAKLFVTNMSDIDVLLAQFDAEGQAAFEAGKRVRELEVELSILHDTNVSLNEQVTHLQDELHKVRSTLTNLRRDIDEIENGEVNPNNYEPADETPDFIDGMPDGFPDEDTGLPPEFSTEQGDAI